MFEDYQKARRAGLRQARHDISAGKYPYPAALDDILKGTGSQGETHVGLAEIDLGLISGTRTRGRQNMFARNWMPIAETNSEFASKWVALHDSAVAEGIREPIKAFEYLQHFYVQEGNKRVSVACYLDAPTIMADVTRVIPMAEDEQAWALYNAFTEFYRACPIYGIVISDAKAYTELAEAAQRNFKEPWPQDEVMALRATFQRFRSAFQARGGDELDVEPGDAFIAYLQIVGYQKALSLTSAQTDDMVERAWSELSVAGKQEAVRLEEPTKPSGGLATSLTAFTQDITLPKPFEVAFIYDESVETSSWVALHEAGRRSLKARMPGAVNTKAYFNCASDEAFDKAIAEIAGQADLVVTVQPTQMTQTLRAAVAWPQIQFLNCSALARGSVRTFACRGYEAKFLMGMVAAACAQNHKIAYVAESPVMGTLSEINAFALGALAMDPYAKIYLTWITEQGYDWRSYLDELADIDVFSGRDTPDPVNPERPWGLIKRDAKGSYGCLGHIAWDWGRYYELMIRSIKGSAWQREERENKNQALSYWWGMSSGVLDIHVSDAVPAGVRELVALARQSVMSHRLEPFAGELISQEGLVQPEGSARLSAEEIVRMSWLAANVVGELPEVDALAPESQEQVKVAGII